jgi:hypothetical protein
MLLGTLVLLLLVIDSGVITGLLRGGRLHGLRGARLKALPLLVAALMLQLLLGLAWLQVPGGRWGIGSVLLLVSLVLLLVVVRANRPVLGARVGVFGIQTVVSVGDVLQYLGLFLLIQALMVRSAGRRPKAAAPPGPWATLLRVAWLAILLGLLLQLALLLVAAGFGKDISPGPLLAETLKTVSWSLLVCVGVALGRVAAKGRMPLEGVTGLLAAPLALTAANTVQKGVAEAVNAAGVPAGPAPVWVLAIKAAEYACLGLALNWVGRRAWGSALGHLAVGLLTGVVFGGVFLTVVVQSAPTPLPTPALVARGLNELLFPVGCALVVFIAEVLRTHLDPATAEDLPLKTSLAAAEEPTPDPVARARSWWGRCASWSGATGPVSATAATSALAGVWAATPALASTAWSGCVGPTAPNSQATDPRATLAATDRHQTARCCRWRRSASGAIAGRRSRRSAWTEEHNE